MDNLVGKSLARKITTSADAIVVSNTFYSVHNLQLTFLQEQCGNTEALHKKLVERYRTVYKGKACRMDVLVLYSAQTKLINNIMMINPKKLIHIRFDVTVM